MGGRSRLTHVRWRRDLTGLFATSGFKAFAGKTVRAIRIPEGAKQSRSFFDKLEERAKTEGAAGLAWVLVEPGNSLKGPIIKFLEPEEIAEIIERARHIPKACIFATFHYYPSKPN